MNFDRITLARRPYEVVRTCRRQAQAQRAAARMGCKVSFIPGRGFVVLRPIDPLTGVAVVSGKGGSQ